LVDVVKVAIVAGLDLHFDQVKYRPFGIFLLELVAVELDRLGFQRVEEDV